MNRALGLSVTALSIAGSLSPVPWVGIVATVVQEIQECCLEVAKYKRKARQLSDRCALLLGNLNDQSARLDGSDLNESVDQLYTALLRIRARVREWSHYSRVKCFTKLQVKNKEIEEGLALSESELVAAMNLFHINAQITLHHSHRESTSIHRRDNEETREMLREILTNQQDLRNIVELQRAGEHAAELVMEAGQEELRSMRQDIHYTHGAGTRKLVATGNQRSPTSIPKDRRYSEYRRGLVALHNATGIPPTVKILDGEVALKALRNIKVSDPKASKRFQHEMRVWANLNDPHILPFYGIATDLGVHIHMVSPWQANGNVLDFVKRRPNDSDRIHLLAGAAQGIQYLHSQGITHGNLKCANILVLASGEACICDFGMSKAQSGNWLSPEIIEGSVSSITTQADTYSYAMATLELLTLRRPYSHRKRDAAVIRDVVINKEHPPRPPALRNDALWKLLKECWSFDPEARPTMATVASRMLSFDAGDNDTIRG
ncbi:hypothetical protein PLICRDRAFT_175127 [Plicaturopsis crispa FD-325 SS-3]|nr:hypothetical protein PLICRDRAFT_175127 [Plicaturopsis crispa FD-325 SS-3]